MTRSENAAADCEHQSSVGTDLVIDTYEAMIEKARLAGKRTISERRKWAREATRLLLRMAER